MTLELAASRFTRCEACNQGIPRGTLRLTYYRDKNIYYHLACWKPDPPAPVQLAFLWNKALPGEMKAEVASWVGSWNKQFGAVEEEVQKKYVGKAIATNSPSLRRLLLVVFQYLTIAETEAIVAYTCKDWLHVSRDGEFWKTRFIAEFRPSETEAQADYRRKYIAFMRVSCWHCKKLVQIEEIRFKCPHFQRPLCWTCSQQKDCAVESVASFLSSRKVTKATLEALAVPQFPYGRKQCSYSTLYRDKLQPHAEARRRLLLHTIDSHFPGRLRAGERRAIELFDFGQFYLGGTRGVVGVEYQLARFCGRSGNRQSERRTAQLFLEDIYSISH